MATKKAHVKFPLRMPGRWRASDIGLGAAGIALAGLAAWFPWHVYSHPASYGPPKMRFSRAGEIAGETEDRIGGRTVGRLFLRADDTDGIDRTPVGSVPPKGNRVAVPSDQPFPGDENIHVVLIANRRALIRDGDVLYPVAVNSLLPGGSRVASFTERGGEWVLVTSRQQVIPVTR